MDLETIIGSKVGTSIRVNSLLIPADSLSNHLLRFSDPALFNTAGLEKYSLSKSGSLTKVKLGVRYFALISYHQIKTPSYDFEQLCIIHSDRKTMFTSHSAVFPNGTQENIEDFDCALFEFTDVVKANKLPETGWYDLGVDLGRKLFPKAIIVCCIGYPGYRNNIDFDKLEYPVAPNAVWGHEIESQIKGRLSFRPKPEIDFDPSGMSGAPIFGVELQYNQPVVFFAGILTNASSQTFNFIPITRIRSLFHQRSVNP